MTDPGSPSALTQPSGGFSEMVEVCRLIADSVDWKITLGMILPYIRRSIIFDNIAIYQTAANESSSDVIYAKAVGRGKSEGDNISWGDVIASQVFESNQMEVNQPESITGQRGNRLDLPYVLGIPFVQRQNRYAVVLVRFGGPNYSSVDKQMISSYSSILSILMKQKQLQDRIATMEYDRQQVILQEDFISTISHELLSPIGFIKGYTTTLMRSDTTWNQSDQREFLAIIDEETDRLQELIDNLLDSSRLQSGMLSMDYQPVRLDTLIRDVIVRAGVHQKSIKIESKIANHLPQIRGDSKRLTQVFENLISNAIKYAPGCVLIISADPVDEQIHITFSDNGPGIAPRYIPNLFHKFFRSPDSPTEVRGTGLGLYICWQIIKAHGGEIFAESDLGKGTTMHIMLPIQVSTSQGV
jgi:signal transduction histidine kinase